MRVISKILLWIYEKSEENKKKTKEKEEEENERKDERKRTHNNLWKKQSALCANKQDGNSTRNE